MDKDTQWSHSVNAGHSVNKVFWCGSGGVWYVDLEIIPVDCGPRALMVLTIKRCAEPMFESLERRVNASKVCKTEFPPHREMLVLRAHMQS